MFFNKEQTGCSDRSDIFARPIPVPRYFSLEMQTLEDYKNALSFYHIGYPFQRLFVVKKIIAGASPKLTPASFKRNHLTVTFAFTGQ